MSGYRILAAAVLLIHLLWIVWVILGGLFTRNRPFWRWFHILSLVYGILVETLPWACPLTLLETWLEERAVVTPYRQDFLVHYLEALVYPDVPQTLLVACAAAVCLFNLGIYAYRFQHRGAVGW